MATEISRVVLKVGSSSLSHANGGLNEAALAQIVDIIAAWRQEGVQCILVTSGAVAAGMGKLGLAKRPRDVAGKQAAAAVGQGALIESYTKHLEKHSLVGAQVLLTRLDLAEAGRYRNAQNTLEQLLRYPVVPIINENDTVAVEELCFGDNDRLSALVAGLVHADLLIILTDVDGLFTANPRNDASARLIGQVTDIAKVTGLADGVGELGSGGMATKLKAAEIATRFGIGMLLVNSKRIKELLSLPSGNRPTGTYFEPAKHRLVGRKRWIAYAGLSEGSIVVDDGAARALVGEGKSLLAKGIVGIDGEWERKELVRIVNQDGREIARGIVELRSEEVQKVHGLHSEQMRSLLPELEGEEVVHRDNMTIMDELWAQ